MRYERDSSRQLSSAGASIQSYGQRDGKQVVAMLQSMLVWREAIGRPLVAIGIQVAGLALLASAAFFIELLMRWAVP